MENILLLRQIFLL